MVAELDIGRTKMVIARRVSKEIQFTVLCRVCLPIILDKNPIAVESDFIFETDTDIKCEECGK